MSSAQVRSGRLPRLWLCLVPILLNWALAAAPSEPSTHTLVLAQKPGIAAGKIAIVEAEAGAEPDHYLVEKLTIQQPVQVVVVTRKAGQEVKVQLCKHLWDEVEQEGSTARDGSVRFQFRTEGDLRIKVAGPAGPCRYQLAVWAGEPIAPPLALPFVPMDEYKKSGGGGTSPVLWVIAGLLGVVVVLLAALVLRKKSQP